jgi:hypothetical protein
MRASDRARDQTAANLSRAAAQGQLSIDTLTWRLERTFQANDVGTLDALVGDLPWSMRTFATLLRDLRRWVAGVRAGDAPPPPLELPEADLVVIGRASSCEVRLADPSVSRRHAQLRRRGAEWRVIDLLSTNGTYLNGRRVSSAVALPGDELAFGAQRFYLPG